MCIGSALPIHWSVISIQHWSLSFELWIGSQVTPSQNSSTFEELYLYPYPQSIVSSHLSCLTQHARLSSATPVISQVIPTQ